MVRKRKKILLCIKKISYNKLKEEEREVGKVRAKERQEKEEREVGEVVDEGERVGKVEED
jgi:hypothetical protein